jgi:hypothetical protein
MEPLLVSMNPSQVTPGKRWDRQVSDRAGSDQEFPPRAERRCKYDRQHEQKVQQVEKIAGGFEWRPFEQHAEAIKEPVDSGQEYKRA